VKRRGGIAIVQDPQDASYPSMPENAIRYVEIDAVLPLDAIGPMLIRLTNEPVETEGAVLMSDHIDLEANISGMDPDVLHGADAFGPPVPFSCPDCGGVLAQFYDGELLRFRCQVGHAYSRESLLAGHTAMLDRSLWAAFNSLNEQANLVRSLVQDAEAQGDRHSAQRFTNLYKQAQRQKESLRQMMLKDEGEDGEAAGGTLSLGRESDSSD
jgi:two-component system, chemotaxis family, protein-glutamate methylesterase/glutaminase